MFTVIRGVLLKPLEYRDPQSLVRISLEDPHGRERDGSFTVLRLEQMTASAKSFSGVGAYLKFKEDMSLSGHGAPEALKGARVSANFLDILGVRPVAGRGFLAEGGRARWTGRDDDQLRSMENAGSIEIRISAAHPLRSIPRFTRSSACCRKALHFPL